MEEYIENHRVSFYSAVKALFLFLPYFLSQWVLWQFSSILFGCVCVVLTYGAFGAWVENRNLYPLLRSVPSKRFFETGKPVYSIIVASSFCLGAFVLPFDSELSELINVSLLVIVLTYIFMSSYVFLK